MNKAKLFLIGAITTQYLVYWDYKFTQNPENGWVEYRLSKSFTDPKEAQEFLKHRPNDKPFECKDQRTGKEGLCIVSGFDIFTKDK